MNTHLSLDGTWQLLPVERFRFPDYPADATHWVEQTLPAHWQQHPLFERYAGNMVYRRRFTFGGHAQPGRRHWLRLHGVFYTSRPFLNGTVLGQHEGYFAPQEYDITPLLQAENELLVEVACPDEPNKTGKRLITGVFSHWDCLDPATNPGGIWRSVEVITTGPTRVASLLLDTASVQDTVAQVRFRAGLDAAMGGTVNLRWTITPRNFAGQIQTLEETRVLAPGQQELAGTLAIRDPQRWWTHDLGHPNCYTITLEIVQDGQVSDRHATVFGIRTVEFKRWIAHLNGVRLFIKGNNYAPGDTRIATMTRERCDQDMRLARACHMNLLRVHAHVGIPELYEAADEAGILLWQDFPLQWLYQRSILPEAERQVRAMVRQLYNHPAVAIWCMHNEALYTADTKDERLLTKVRQYASVFGWNWNRDVMDTRLKQVARHEDATRPVVRSSGEYAVPGLRAGTDTHFYFGWYTVYGKLHEWEGPIRKFPANVRFVTEFGAQSFPNLESATRFMNADIATIDWQHLAERHQFQPEIMAHWLDWRSAASLPDLIAMTQGYQSEINRFYIDRLRLRKYKPTGGVVPFMFHDPNPAVQWSILDYWRVPKASYWAMRLAFSPLYAFALVPPGSRPPGQPIDLPMYVVNDARSAQAVSVRIRLSDSQGAELASAERRYELAADSQPLEIDRLRLTPEQPGEYTLVLAWEYDGEQLENTYRIVVG